MANLVPESGPPARAESSSQPAWGSAACQEANDGRSPGREQRQGSGSHSTAPAEAAPNGCPAIPDHELIRQVGGGSYGEVWLARNVMGAYRAVKIVYRRNFGNDRPFEREFRGIQKFEPISRTHDSQVDILHIGRNHDYFYYVMELADDAGPERQERSDGVLECRSNGHNGFSGLPNTPPLDQSTNPVIQQPISPALRCSPSAYVPRTLKLDLSRRGRLPVAECVDIGIRLATALAHLHQHGLVHRDVKPSNVIFIAGIPKLADIGLVTGVDATVSCVGTEGFIPPEGPGTPQADLYALGKVLYEISTGKDRQDYPEPPTQLGDFSDREQLLELGEIIKKACVQDPTRRYQSAEALQADLLLLKTGRSVRHAHQLERRLKVMTRVAIGVAAAMLLGVVPYSLAIKEALRARHAEIQAKEKLWGSYLAQAQAGRFSRRAGRRFEGLELLRKAAALRPSLELRNEAIACLALPDIREARRWAVPNANNGHRAFDSTRRRWATSDAQGNITLRSLDDSQPMDGLPGCGRDVSLMQFSPTGRFLAAAYVATNKPALKIWDLDRRVVVLEPDIGNCRTLDFAKDESQVAVNDTRVAILIYDLHAGAQLKRIPYSAPAQRIAFSPDARRLAISSDGDSTAVILDVHSGATLQSLTHEGGPVCGLAWSPSGELLVTGCFDGRICLWEVSSGARRGLLGKHQSAAVAVCFNHRGDLLSSVGWDGRLRLWDLIGGNEICEAPASDYFCPFTPDDRGLVCRVSGEDLRLFDVASGEACRQIEAEEKVGPEPHGCAFSPNGEVLATAHHDGVRLFDIQSGKQIAFQPTDMEVLSVKFNTSRGTLITCQGRGVKEWPVSVGWDRRRERPVARSTRGVLALNNRLADLLTQTPVNPVASWGGDGGADNTQTMRPAANLNLKPIPDSGARALLGPGEDVKIVVPRSWDYSACNENTLAVALGTRIRLIDLGTRHQRQQLCPEGVRCLITALSPDGKWCAGGTWLTNLAEIFDAQTGAHVRTLPACRSTGRLVFSPDSRWLAMCGADECCFFDTSSWERVGSVARPATGDIRGVAAFSPDSRIAAISHSPQLIKLVDPATGREIATLEAPEAPNIAALAFSPDGSQLAATTWSHVIQIWDLRFIRQELAAMNLDWELPPYPSPRPPEPLDSGAAVALASRR